MWFSNSSRCLLGGTYKGCVPLPCCDIVPWVFGVAIVLGGWVRMWSPCVCAFGLVRVSVHLGLGPCIEALGVWLRGSVRCLPPSPRACRPYFVMAFVLGFFRVDASWSWIKARSLVCGPLPGWSVG